MQVLERMRLREACGIEDVEVGGLTGIAGCARSQRKLLGVPRGPGALPGDIAADPAGGRARVYRNEQPRWVAVGRRRRA